MEDVKEEIEGERKQHQQQMKTKQNSETATSTTSTRTEDQKNENTWHIFTKRRRSKQRVEKLKWTSKRVECVREETQKSKHSSAKGKDNMTVMVK